MQPKYQFQSSVQNQTQEDQMTNKNMLSQSLFEDLFFKNSDKEDIFFRKQMKAPSQIYDQEIFNQEKHFSIAEQSKNYDKFLFLNQNSGNKQKSQILKRNRECAKQSRDKKKLYIEQLEKKCFQNQKKINDLTKRLRESEIELNRLKNNSNKRPQSFSEFHRISMAELNEITNSKMVRQVILKSCMDAKSNFGPAGKLRLDLLNYLMSQYVQNLLADFQKYFIMSITQQKGIFGNKNPSQLDLEIRKILEINQVKNQKLNKKYLKTIEKSVDNFVQTKNRLYECHIDMQSRLKQFEEALTPMLISQTTPQNCTKFMVLFDTDMHLFDIRQLKSKWSDTFSNENQLKPKDQIKKKNRLTKEQEQQQFLL